jgi:large subunit ribosomal protein L10
MASQVKEKFVENLTDDLKGSAHLLISEYSGMTAEEFDALRAVLNPMGAKFKVVKNRLAKIAFDKSGFNDLQNYMKGPSAIAYQGNDGASLTKALLKFSEQHSNLKIRAGRLFGITADFKTLKSMAELPSKEVLLATLCVRIQSPLYSLARTLNQPLQSLHSALTALAKKKAPAA